MSARRKGQKQVKSAVVEAGEYSLTTGAERVLEGATP